MNHSYDVFRDRAFSALRGLAKDCPEFEDAEMLVGSAESTASLHKHAIFKSIDTDWLDAIEKALPALDSIIRNPSVAIEDVDEILPVELSRHITDKSIKHLAQHTNLILDIRGDEVTPSKILNVYHDETYLTYENKFINTLLNRLLAFVDKRYRALVDGSGTEQNYQFEYSTAFEHHALEEGGRNAAKITLNIELTTPLLQAEGEDGGDINARYTDAIQRVRRINAALMAYQSSAFVQHLGRNFIRPPIIRTNAILKNKNLKECLTLWEFIEGFDKVGYSVRTDDEVEMPSEQYVSDFYSAVALQYVHFYHGVAESEDNRLLSQKHLFDVAPEFETDVSPEEWGDYRVYDSEYKKMVPVSRLMSNRKKLSADERRISDAIAVALKADDLLRQAEEKRRRAEEKARALEEQRRREEEERRRAEEQARIEAEAKAEAERLAAQRAEEERLAAEKAEAERLAAQRAEEERLAAEKAEAERLAAQRAEEERLAAEKAEAERQAVQRAEEERLAAEKAERERIAAERIAERNKDPLTLARRGVGVDDGEPLILFKDDAPRAGAVVIPYTRQQYLTMPRKKKKRLMTMARKAAEKESTPS